MIILRRSLGTVFLQIEPGLWQITFHYPATTNCWLILDEDGLTLVDAGNPWNAETIMSAINYLGHPLSRIIITHAHPDHAGAAAEIARLTSARVFAHQADIPFLEGHSSMADLPGFWLCQMLLKTAAGLGMLNPPRLENVEPLADGDTIGQIQALHTPGHTPGSLSLWAASRQTLFCGDNISNIARLHLGLPWFTLDLKARDQSLRRYTGLPARTLLLGHGPLYSAENAVDDLLRLLPP